MESGKTELGFSNYGLINHICLFNRPVNFQQSQYWSWINHTRIAQREQKNAEHKQQTNAEYKHRVAEMFEIPKEAKA